MSLKIGETIVLYAVLLLNIVAFTNDGWICGRLYSQMCLEASYVIVVVVGVLATVIVLTLIVVILQTVVAFIDPDSSASSSLQVSAKVLACLVAILECGNDAFSLEEDTVVCLWDLSSAAFIMWNYNGTGMDGGVELYYPPRVVQTTQCRTLGATVEAHSF
uniref:Expressed conserved protein n=1 Tax=Echinococcus granulosus TaxID=6210 RepID=A0A068X4S1_ECHGR|nr:hypothetical protein EgrG_002053500 [Echinococcus granulosus]